MLGGVGRTSDQILEAALNGLSVRLDVIANNIANIDTPGFKGSAVSFEEQLREALAQGSHPQLALRRTQPGHLSATEEQDGAFVPLISTSNETALRNDGNNVDIDAEMVRLAETHLTYNAIVQLVSARLSLMKTIVNEGRR